MLLTVPCNSGDGSIFSFHISRLPLQESNWHMVKYINSKDNATFEDTVKAAELFQKQEK
jgi:hypothetical protein